MHEYECQIPCGFDGAGLSLVSFLQSEDFHTAPGGLRRLLLHLTQTQHCLRNILIYNDSYKSPFIQPCKIKTFKAFYLLTYLFPEINYILKIFYFCSCLILRISFVRISLQISSINTCKSFCPSSPKKRLLTETFPSSCSFSPTTSI